MSESNRLTREYIKTAMLELLAKKNVAKISITELVARAGVSRTAFYRNFSSKEELMDEIVYDLLDKISLENIKNMINYTKEQYINFFSLLRSKKKEILLITSAGVENISIINRNHSLSEAIVKQNEGLSFEEVAFRGAVNAITYKWILNGMKETDEQMGNILYSIIYERK